MKPTIKILFVLMLSILSITSAFAKFSGEGLGTERSPYLITNADELFEVRNDLSAYYKLMNDIDLSEWLTENASSQGWSPIGNENTPFTGVFDGDNHVIKGILINRENNDNIGLFGVIRLATIQNVSILHPQIKGHSNVGGLVGKFDLETGIERHTTLVNNCSVIGGSVYGGDGVGGIVGTAIATTLENSNSNQIINNICTTDIKGLKCGGILGLCNGSTCNDALDQTIIVYNNAFYGKISGVNNNNEIGGSIVGFINECTFNNYGWEYGNDFHGYWNIGGGVLSNNGIVGGILGLLTEDLYGWGNGISNGNQLYCNVCVADTISGTSIKRIANAPTECIWSNYGYTNTVGVQNGKAFEFLDDEYNGIAYGKKLLMEATTYEGLGFDFSNDWSIVEGETFPFKKFQSLPPKITEVIAGSRGKIAGTVEKDGWVYAIVDGELYQTYSIDGSWGITTGILKEYQTVEVINHTPSLQPSISVKATAVASPNVEPDIKAGDSNGDGVVDVADVVAVINYIAGKASSSFSTANADVNGDGQVLVDDAVAIVKQILNAQ